MNQKTIVRGNLSEISTLLSCGKLEQAEKLCLSSLERSPGDKDLLVKLSLIYQLMGAGDKAKEAFGQIDEKLLETLFFMHQSMDFYLRNKNYAEAKKLLDIANEANYHRPRLRLRTQKMNMIFNSQTECKEKNVALAQEYINEYPDDPFGYSYFIQSISYTKPDNLPEILKSLKEQIKKNGLPLSLLKQLLAAEQRLYSLLRVNSYELAEQRTKSLLIERLRILFLLNQDTAEIEEVIDELFATPLSRTELTSLIRESFRYKALESKLIEYCAEHPQWQQYDLIKNQIEIIKENRQLQATPLPESQTEFPHPVDVVFTWCDMRDPVFLEKFERQNGFNPMKSEDETNGKFRFINNQEIKLALISLFKYFDALNHIYIVTNEQIFELDFLSIEQKQKISFVDHSEIMPEKNIKGDVFNSNLIETFLWKIPNLKEHFLYFNDDVILGNYLRPHHLFDADNNPLIFTAPRKHNANFELNKLIEFHQEEVVPWNISRVNAMTQFQTKNQILLPFTNVHQGMFLVRSECAKAFEKYESWWQDGFFQEMLRGRNAVFSPLTYIWESALSGTQKIGEYYEYNRLSAVFNAGLNSENVQYIKEVKPLFYCLNHLPDESSIAQLHSLINYVVGVNHPPLVEQLGNYLARATEVERIIYVGLGSFNQISQVVEELEINLQECYGSDINSLRRINTQIVDEQLLTSKLTINDGILEQSIVVFLDVVEEIVQSKVLIDTLVEWSNKCKYLLLSTPARDKVTDFANSISDEEQHVSHKWCFQDLYQFLSSQGFPIGFAGYTTSDRCSDHKTESLMISGKEAVYQPQVLVPVTAIINCYNESDIIKDVVLYLVEQNIKVVVVDNWSTDGSYEIVNRLSRQDSNISVIRFPDAPSVSFNLNEQLLNTVYLSEQFGKGWYLHYDADEIRESPWQGVNLREAISFVDSLGYNAIEFTIATFRYLPEDEEYLSLSPVKRLRYWHFGEHNGNFNQVKGWKNYGQKVNLNQSGGHIAEFPDQKIYPLKFLTRHYPLRSREQAHQKLFCDRFPRFRDERQRLGWHSHYDSITEKQLEGWDKRFLKPWNRVVFNTEYLVERLSGIGISKAKPIEENSESYRQAIDKHPDNARMYFMLAKTQRDEGHLEEALVSANKALELDSDNVDVVELISQLLIEMGWVTEAQSVVEALLPAQENNPRLQRIWGNLLREQGDLERATAAYGQSVELMPQNVESYVNFCELLFETKRIPETIAACQKALEWHVSEFRLYFVLGKAYDARQEWQKAVDSYRQAIAYSGESSSIIYVRLGNSLTQLGNKVEAVENYKNAIRFQPNSPHGYTALGNYYRQKQDLSQAVHYYEQVIQMDFQNSGVYFALGQSLRLQDLIDKAIEAYRSATQLDPKFLQAYMGLAHCYVRQHNWDLAIANFQQVLQLDSKNADAYFYLGQMFNRRGEQEKAITNYQKTLELSDAKSADVYNSLGDVFQQINDLDQAVAAYKEAIKIQPDHLGAQQNLQQLNRG